MNMKTNVSNAQVTLTPGQQQAQEIRERGKLRRKTKEELKYQIAHLTKQMSSISPKVLASKDGKRLVNYLQTLRVQLMSVDLYAYVQGMWNVAPTGSIFSPQWYIECICEHIEQMLDLEFLKLIVSISPRSAKSTIISQLTPTWLWINNPKETFISASYGDDLVKRDMQVSRDIIDSPEYQQNWGHLYSWTKDQNEKKYYKNSEDGFRIAVTPTGKGTGFGCTWMMVDDPHKAQEARNQKLIEGVYYNWWKGAMFNRHQSVETFRRVVIHQRLAEYDLAGMLQEHDDDWVLLSLQERFTGQVFIGHNWKDPRTKLGQLLKPDLLDEKSAKEIETEPFTWASQYMQDPVVDGGSYIKLDEIKTYDESTQPALEDFETLITSWDVSNGSIEASASFTCGICIGIIGAKKYILGWEYDKCDFPDQVKMFKRLKLRYPQAKLHLIENHANGPTLIQHLEKVELELIKGDTLIPINPKDYGGDKVTRLFACLPEFRDNHVYMPSKEHGTLGVESSLFMSHLTGFPKKKDKDFVDATSQVLNYVFLNPQTANNSGGTAIALDLQHHQAFAIEQPFDVSRDVSEVANLFNSPW